MLLSQFSVNSPQGRKQSKLPQSIILWKYCGCTARWPFVFKFQLLKSTSVFDYFKAFAAHGFETNHWLNEHRMRISDVTTNACWWCNSIQQHLALWTHSVTATPESPNAFSDFLASSLHSSEKHAYCRSCTETETLLFQSQTRSSASPNVVSVTRASCSLLCGYQRALWKHFDGENGATLRSARSCFLSVCEKRFLFTAPRKFSDGLKAVEVCFCCFAWHLGD